MGIASFQGGNQFIELEWQLLLKQSKDVTLKEIFERVSQLRQRIIFTQPLYYANQNFQIA